MSTPPPLTAQRALAEYRASLAHYDHLLSENPELDYVPEWRDNIEAVVTRLTADPSGWEREEAAAAEAQAAEVYATRPTLDAVDSLFENRGRCTATYTHAAALLRARDARYRNSGQCTPAWDSHYQARITERAERYDEDADSSRSREANRSNPNSSVAVLLEGKK